MRFLIDIDSKKRKQNISMPIKSEVKQESDATIKKVEEDRGLTIQVSVLLSNSTLTTLRLLLYA